MYWFVVRVFRTDHCHGNWRSTVCLNGQAAGTAAALSLNTGNDLRQVAVPELQGILQKDGLFLG